MKPLGALIFTRALFLLILILKQTDCDGRVNTQLRHLRRTKRLASGSSALVARQPVRLGSPRNIHYPSSPRLSVWRCSMSSRAQDGVGGGNQGIGGNKRAHGWSNSKGEDGEDGDDEPRDSIPATEASRTLERLFAQPAAPRRRELSEGLGKGVPSPQQRVRLEQENLELTWRMAGQRDMSVCCRDCAGEGKCECRFCNGTGLFKVGGDLMLHPATGRPPPCPVCKSTGEEQCQRCKGAGRIAVWLLRNNKRSGR